MKTGILLTINEAATIKGVSRQAIHAAIEAGRLEFIEVPAVSKRIAPDVLAAFKVNPKMKLSGRKPSKRTSSRKVTT
jgi:hypothetical protein